MTIGIRYLPETERRAYMRRANKRYRGRSSRAKTARTEQHLVRQRDYWRRWNERKRALLASNGIEPTRKNARLYSIKDLTNRERRTA